VQPDAVLLRRELRWIAAAMLTFGAAGYLSSGPWGAATGAGAGFLAQQAAYWVVVRILWNGWTIRTLAYEEPERAKQVFRITLRAFTLWMRTASANDRLYVALWNVGNDEDDQDEDVTESVAERRIRDAHTIARNLDNTALWCDDLYRRRLRSSLQRDEARLLRIATGKRLEN
jgi:hypothetical protein